MCRLLDYMRYDSGGDPSINKTPETAHDFRKLLSYSIVNITGKGHFYNFFLDGTHAFGRDGFY